MAFYFALTLRLSYCKVQAYYWISWTLEGGTEGPLVPLDFLVWYFPKRFSVENAFRLVSSLQNEFSPLFPLLEKSSLGLPWKKFRWRPSCVLSSNPGLYSLNSNYRLRLWLQLQAYKVFGSGSKIVWSIGNWKALYYLYISLTQTLRLWNRNPNFRLRLRFRLHHLKVFGSGSHWLQLYLLWNNFYLI